MSATNDFLDYIKDQLADWDLIYSKRMFGVLGLYCQGLMFGIISNDVVYLKVDDSNKDKFLDMGSTPLKVFKNNSVVPSYYELPVEILEDADVFVKWAKESYMIQVNKNGPKP